MAKLQTNYEFVSDKSKNPVTSDEFVKHGDQWLNTVVNTAVTTIGNKADKSYVDTELAKKANAADLTALETTVSGKADNSTVSAVSERVTQNTTKTVDLQSQIDSLVISGGGDSNPEVVQARTGTDGVTHTTLKNRIDSEVTDLKSDLSAGLKNISLNSVPIYSHNLFDKSKVTTGYYVDYTTGNLIENSSFSVSDFIYVRPNTNYNFHLSNKPDERVQQMAFFDINRKYITGISNQGINQDVNVTTPNEAYFIRWSIVNSNINNVILEEGNEYTYYSPYEEISSLKELVDIRTKADGSKASSAGAAVREQIADVKSDLSAGLKNISPNSVPIYSHNLFDKSKVTTGYYVDYTTGNLIENSSFSVSDFIYVRPNTNYNFHLSNKPDERVQQMAFFDINRKYITGISNQGINQDVNVTTPNEAYFIRWSILNSNINNVILEEGNEYTYYSPYEEISSLKSEKVVTVGVGGTFLYLIDALKKTSNDTVVKLLSGEFDIEEEYKYFYGDDFWTTQYQGYQSSNDEFMRGLWLGKGRKLISDGGAVVKMLYSGDRGTVRSNFSVFANDTDVLIDGIVIKYANVRYAIHDDFQPNGGNVIFKNIVFEGSPFSDAAIGAGLGVNTNYLIDNCIFLGNTKTYDISYHGNTDTRKTSNKCKVIVTNCYGNKKCAFRWYGTSTKTSDCIVNNSHFSNIECLPYNDEQMIENMRLTAYCNEIETL